MASVKAVRHIFLSKNAYFCASNRLSVSTFILGTRNYSVNRIPVVSQSEFRYHLHGASFPGELPLLCTTNLTKNRLVALPQVEFLRSMSSSSSIGGTNPNPSFNLPNSGKESSEKQTSESAATASPSQPNQTLSNKEKLKQAVRDYGATVIVFHVTMSLMSLGICYLLVQSGLDVASILAKLGISESILQSKATEEAGKFVVAYAIHKVFAPVRITITLTATPFIVRKLRSMGILKEMAKRKTQ